MKQNATSKGCVKQYHQTIHKIFTIGTKIDSTERIQTTKFY